MTPVRKKFIQIIESLPYNIDEEILKKDTKEILREVTRSYVNTYGFHDLSENDQEGIKLLMGDKLHEERK